MVMEMMMMATKMWSVKMWSEHSFILLLQVLENKNIDPVC